MAQRGVGLKGRTIVGLLLGAFLVVALSIVWRRTIGISESRRLTALEATRAQLESERARVQSDIRDASTRQHLGSVVETRLGMHVPSDKQVVILPRQGASETP
jgi:cell division protein FtsL